MSVYNVDGAAVSSLFDVEETALVTGYDIDGQIVFSGIPLPVDYDNYTISSLYNISVTLCQGIAVYNDVLFQFRSDSSNSDKVCLFDFTDGSDIIRNMDIDADHGDSASFSDEFYAEGDEFPLLYVTADTTPAVIYVNRVTRSTATLIKTLKFPQTAGYYGAGAYDFENGICYVLAYKENNYRTDDGGENKTIVSLWDLNRLTDNGDGTYTPEFISQYERDFIFVMQGLAYHDGYIWICSGATGTSQYIYAMNPTTGVIDHTITMDTTTEIEGVDFVFKPSTQDYYMVTCQQGGKYKKITFGYLSN